MQIAVHAAGTRIFLLFRDGFLLGSGNLQPCLVKISFNLPLLVSATDFARLSLQ